MSIVKDTDAVGEARRGLRARLPARTTYPNPLGWCTRCGYTPPGRKKIIWTDFDTGQPVNGNPWERS